MGQAELARRMGDRYDNSVISRVERGQSSLAVDGLKQAALALGVSTDYLLGLTEDPRPSDKRLSHLEPPNSVLISGDSEISGLPADVSSREMNKLPFSRVWLEDREISAEQARVYRVNGHVMHPTIYSGDVILVDYERTELIDGSVYLVKKSDSVLIGRARFSGGEWYLFNRTSGRMNDEATLGTEKEVRGQVCWIGRSQLRSPERSKSLRVPSD